MQSRLDESGEDAWQKIEPLLNDAISSLAEKDRDAIVLRFIEGRELKEVAATLGITADAAKKRVARAVEKLRAAFSVRGTAVSDEALTQAIGAKAVQAAPATLMAVVITEALAKGTLPVSTLSFMKGLLKMMTWTKMKTAVVTAGAAVLLGTGSIAIISSLSAEQKVEKPATADSKEVIAPATKFSRQALVFRNVRSWNRRPDFEEVLTELAFKYDVKPSAEMENTDLAPYGFVIIPGSQQRGGYYDDYIASSARFDSYVKSGGTLVLELNGAEDTGIVIPGGVTMATHGALDNLIIVADHPVLAPLAGKKQIHANYASHGYLEGVPKEAIMLMTETAGEQPALDRPTFVEYRYGKGRVLAACQCFHDRDKSGRGPLMPALLSYAAERDWYGAKK
jgi:hypothetical protein